MKNNMAGGRKIVKSISFDKTVLIDLTKRAKSSGLAVSHYLNLLLDSLFSRAQYTPASLELHEQRALARFLKDLQQSLRKLAPVVARCNK